MDCLIKHKSVGYEPMNMDISTTEIKQADVSDKRAMPDMSYEAQTERIRMVADMLERGIRSTKGLSEGLLQLGVTVGRDTVINYRNKALHILEEEQKPMNREHLRNLEIGRLNYWIEDLSGRINRLDWSVLDEKTGEPVAFEMYNKMLQRLKDMAEQLHKITGLQTIVNVNVDEKRRIVFVRPQEAKDVKDSATEGQIVEAKQ